MPGSPGTAHREAVERFRSEMRGRGEKPVVAAPPLFRLLWALGLEVPPPAFLSFRVVAFAMGIYFGAFLATVEVVRGRIQGDLADLVAGAFSAGVGGATFGLLMAWMHRRKADRLHLPSWEEFRDGARLPPDLRRKFRPLGPLPPVKPLPDRWPD